MSSLAEAVAALLGRLTHLEEPVVTVISRLLAILAYLLVTVLLYRGASHLVDRVLHPLETASDDLGKVQRAATLRPLMKNVSLYTLSFLALVVILREVGVDIRALLVSAGVLGLALGLGAQTLIKDVITGVFILFEGLLGVGDVIEVGGHTGTVESIGLRVTKMRLLNGAQRIVPNGELTQFINYTRGWGRAVVDVSVGYDSDVGRAMQVLERVGQGWAKESGLALETPEVQGVTRFGESDLQLRLMVKVDARRRDVAEQDLRRRIKEAFEREGIPFPQRVVYLQSKNKP
ncbi:MAG TPA: mechanosensitive ion channel family protein [Methylomirabilota bacterium]|nr:mechanosensitive ion channel family protein [Methylomirabilota bacterium]